MPCVDLKSAVHVAFDKPIKAWVNETILHGLDETKSDLRECQIIGLSSYKDCALSAQILIKEGKNYSTIWSDVPLHMLFHKAAKPKEEEMLNMDDVVYHNNPDEYISLTYYPALAIGKCQSYFRKKDKWLSGEYILTVDWYRSNYSAHLVALENGQFGFIPNHKIQFNNGDRNLPDYKKSRQEWKLENA